MKSTKKILLLLWLLVFVTSVGITWKLKHSPPREVIPVASVSFSPSPIPTPVPTPVTLSIPSLQVTAAIQPVGVDEKGRMGVPDNYADVSWYQLGVRPGEKGSAVIAGHLDSPTGPAVFYRLDQLKLGDEILIKDESQQVRVFQVTDKQVYSDTTFPIPLIFEQRDKARLNLITCDGVFDTLNKNYSHRLVVFTELQP